MQPHTPEAKVNGSHWATWRCPCEESHANRAYVDLHRDRWRTDSSHCLGESSVNLDAFNDLVVNHTNLMSVKKLVNKWRLRFRKQKQSCQVTAPCLDFLINFGKREVSKKIYPCLSPYGPVVYHHVFRFDLSQWRRNYTKKNTEVCTRAKILWWRIFRTMFDRGAWQKRAKKATYRCCEL